MQYLLALVVCLHGLVHLAGFAASRRPGILPVLKQQITEWAGVLWLLAALLFLAAATMLVVRPEACWVPASVAVLLSQLLIFGNWADARGGTLVNVVLALVIFLQLAALQFRRQYRSDVRKNLATVRPGGEELLSEADLRALPRLVKKYLYYTGSVGRPKITHFRAVSNGSLRAYGSDTWMPFRSEQYNFLCPAGRMYFLRATMNKLPVAGYHRFGNGEARMDVRLLSLFKVAYQEGREMNTAETVTFFNDMCCLAPATLTDKRIRWLGEKGDTVYTSFSDNNITVHALLCFNDEGELINFISEDRYAEMNDGSMKRLRWSTPLKNYRRVNGYRLATEAEAIYRYPEGNFCYGRFRLLEVTYNTPAPAR